MTSHDRHLPGKRRTGPDRHPTPDIPADQGAVQDEGDHATGAQDEGDQGEWGRPGQPDRAGQAEQRDDTDEYEPL